MHVNFYFFLNFFLKFVLKKPAKSKFCVNIYALLNTRNFLLSFNYFKILGFNQEKAFKPKKLRTSEGFILIFL